MHAAAPNTAHRSRIFILLAHAGRNNIMRTTKSPLTQEVLVKAYTTLPITLFAVAAIAALGLATSSTVLAAPSAAASAAPTVVAIKDFVFTPNVVRIPVGGSVTWKNLDHAPHTVTDSGSRAFDSGRLSTGKTYTYTFDKAGAYKYVCDFHSSMVATILVGSNATPAPSASNRSDDSDDNDDHDDHR
jgi:plastocyanin